jgi:hypothetical protein
VNATLARGEAEEDAQNVQLAKRGVPPLPHKHEHATLSRMLKPLLEREAAARAAAAATATLSDAQTKRDSWLQVRCGSGARSVLASQQAELRALPCCSTWRLCYVEYRR